MKLILAALAALSIGAYLYGEEAQTADSAAAEGQIVKATQPDLGSTVVYLTGKYGKPVKVEKAWCGGTAYGFQPTNTTYVYAIESNGTVGDIMYFDFNKPQITQEDAVKLFRSQFPTTPPITWTDKEYKNGLGQRRENTGSIRNRSPEPLVWSTGVSPSSAIQRIRDGSSVLPSSLPRSNL